MLTVVIVVLTLVVLGPLGLLELWSLPGSPKPFLDADGKPVTDSISEKIYVDVNGARQGMFIVGKSTKNPVLLYLHGGMPDYFLTEGHPTRLEESFTVVWWEQRGVGISYRSDVDPATLTAEQYISDAVALTAYLRERFGQEKIYVMAHSGGTFFGIQLVARHPELFHAYIAVAQIADQRRSEKLAYDWMLARYRADGNGDMVARLEAKPVTLEGGTPDGYAEVRDTAMHELGVGTTHEMRSVVRGILLPSLQSPQYTAGEKLRTWRGKASSGISTMWKEVMATNLAEVVPEVAVPVYFLEGVYDYTCAYEVAKDYFRTLKAPIKGFYTFDQSAHSPLFEEPDKARKILETDVLRGRNDLADPTP